MGGPHIWTVEEAKSSTHGLTFVRGQIDDNRSIRICSYPNIFADARGKLPLFKASTLVLYINGYECTKIGSKFASILQWCRRNGYPFVSFDHSRLDDITKATLSEWVDDANIVYQKCVAKSEKIIVIGYSIGAAVTLRASHLYQWNSVRGAIFLAAASPDSIYKKLSEKASVREDHLELESQCDENKTYKYGLEFYEDLKVHFFFNEDKDWLERAIITHFPTAIWYHGEGDDDVPLAASRKIFNLLPQPSRTAIRSNMYDVEESRLRVARAIPAPYQALISCETSSDGFGGDEFFLSSRLTEMSDDYEYTGKYNGSLKRVSGLYYEVRMSRFVFVTNPIGDHSLSTLEDRDVILSFLDAISTFRDS